MEEKTKKSVILAGIGVLVLACVTVLLAGSFLLGVTFLQRQAQAGMVDEASAALSISDPRPDASSIYRGSGGPGMMWGSGGPGGVRRGYLPGSGCADGSFGQGMMSRGWSQGEMPCTDQEYAAPDRDSALSLEEAKEAVEGYVQRLGLDGLHVSEVMEFEHNFYAIVAEEDTGIGALELLVDKNRGTVGLEPGPNMMWNAKYGMHRGGGMMGGMMGGRFADDASSTMTVSPGEAEELAQRWLDANLPGRVASEADPFYGYYTLHYLNDGAIEGMLSVHGSSGDVWYHGWHGDYVAMIGEHE